MTTASTDTSPAGPPPDARESLSRLQRAGWSLTANQFQATNGRVWIVTGTNGENQLLTTSTDLDQAWWHACIQARSVGMLGRADR